LALPAAVLAVLSGMPASAQDDPDLLEEDAPVRTRIGLGPKVYPSYPGSDEYSIGPLIEFERARGDQPFLFEAADDSFGFSLFKGSGFSIGPVADWEGKRTAEDVGANVPEVDFSIEVGAAAALWLSDNFRVRAELRRGIIGHEGLIGTAGADAVFRDGDRWLFAIGPRLTYTDDEYQDTWFGVSPAAALSSGLPAYNPGGGVQAVGGTASLILQFSPQWGMFTFAKYDRLVGDAASSPLVTGYGSRDQFSGGAALTYTFGPGVH
jgi:outer membrane protein